MSRLGRMRARGSAICSGAMHESLHVRNHDGSRIGAELRRRVRHAGDMQAARSFGRGSRRPGARVFGQDSEPRTTLRVLGGGGQREADLRGVLERSALQRQATRSVIRDRGQHLPSCADRVGAGPERVARPRRCGDGSLGQVRSLLLAVLGVPRGRADTACGVWASDDKFPARASHTSSERRLVEATPILADEVASCAVFGTGIELRDLCVGASRRKRTEEFQGTLGLLRFRPAQF